MSEKNLKKSSTDERKALNERLKKAQKKKAVSRFYKLNSLLGNQCMFYVILGGRMTGKSYSLAEFITKQKRELGDQYKSFWMRISDKSVQKMKADKCKGLIDPDIQRKYKLDLSSKGMYVKNKKKEFMQLMCLGDMGKDKGCAIYDKDFTGQIDIILDEFQLEQGEKRTSFDILYNFIGQLENILRTKKSKVRVFLVGNTLEEASSILRAFNFIPQSFGRFYLHRWNKYTKKRELYAVIDNLEPTEDYLRDRYGSAADILGGSALSNYSNELSRDTEMITGNRLVRPETIIKFSKYKSDWFTVWSDCKGQRVIRRWKGEMIHDDIAMIPHLPSQFIVERKQNIVDMYNARAFYYTSYIDQTYFQEAMKQIITKK